MESGGHVRSSTCQEMCEYGWKGTGKDELVNGEWGSCGVVYRILGSYE